MKMSVGMLDHYNVSTSKLNETVHFYGIMAQTPQAI